MSSRADELIAMARRGERVRAIREALSVTAEQLAKDANAAALGYGVALGLTDVQLSRVERGGRRISAEEAWILARLDPEGRGVEWLVFGGPPVAISREKRPAGKTTATPGRGEGRVDGRQKEVRKTGTGGR